MTQASKALLRKSEAIMKSWEARARVEVASAFGSASLTLRDALPKHLNQLAAALASCGDKTTTEIADITTHKEGVGKRHGHDRATSSDYSLAEVIFEYRILRQTVIQVLEEETPLSGTEREIITDLIEQAVNDAASEFTEVHRDIREQFTAVLTHDLKGPITASKSLAELIVRRSDRADLCLKSASRIVESLDRIDAMIGNLLDSGRIRAGQGLSVIFAECDPISIAAEVIDEMILVYGTRFAMSSDKEMRTWWSGDYFRRALENLLSNAVKYGSAYTPIKLSLTESPASIRITVHNEGNPIPANEIPKVFENYRRSKSAEASPGSGWGLGLTLVSGVVEAHHGTIEVESSEEKGTSFTMILPKDGRAAPRSL